jgi:hypothetical protein
VTKMTGWGATVKPGDRDGIVDFLFKISDPGEFRRAPR